MEEACVSYNHELLLQVYRDSKNIFSRHGIPEEVVMDNGLQFDFNTFCRISKEYREAEQGVKTVREDFVKKR